MRYCSVLNCNTDQTYKIRFHSFSKDEKLKKKRRVTSQQGQVSGLREKFSVVCAKHLENKYVSGRNLIYNAVPSLHPPHHPHQQEQLDNGEGES